jgi:4a-hydroxytetrahydrobiopterin dehydratase
MTNLNKQEVQDKMKEIDVLWVVEGKFIHREIIFKDFVEAFSFMTAAIIAEKSDHHPNWKMYITKLLILTS